MFPLRCAAARPRSWPRTPAQYFRSAAHCISIDKTNWIRAFNRTQAPPLRFEFTRPSIPRTLSKLLEGTLLVKPGKCPGSRTFGGLVLEYQNSPLLAFQLFRLFTARRTCWAFWLLRLVYRLRKLTTLTCIVFECLKRIEPKSTTLCYPRFISKSIHPWSSAEIF